MGNDTVIGFADSQGNFELNVFNPVIIFNFLNSAKLLSDAMRSFADHMEKGINPNLKKINSKLELETFPIKLDENNAESLIRGVDLILDGLDSLHARMILNKYAVKLNIPYIFASVQDAFGSVTTIIPHRTACLSCFMKDSDSIPPCAVGVYPPAVFAISSIVASEALAIIIQRKPTSAGRLLVFDLETMSFDSVYLKKNPTCKVCGV